MLPGVWVGEGCPEQTLLLGCRPRALRELPFPLKDSPWPERGTGVSPEPLVPGASVVQGSVVEAKDLGGREMAAASGSRRDLEQVSGLLFSHV